MLNQYQQIFGTLPKTILHVGANEGQEIEAYVKAGCKAVYIEAIPEIYHKLEEKCAAYDNHIALNACCTDKKGEIVQFKIASNGGQSSSLYDMGYSSDEYPSINYVSEIELSTTTIDNLIHEFVPQFQFDCIVLDIQGAELLALKGAHEFLHRPHLKAITVEVAHQELYQNGATFQAIITFLEKYHFYLQQVHFNTQGWGDAMFVRKWWGKDSKLVQNLFSNYQKMTDVQVQNIFLSSSFDPNTSSQQVIRALASDTMASAFQTLEESNPYIIIEFDRPLPYGYSIALYNCKGFKGKRLTSIRVEYSNNGTNWKPIPKTAYQNEFLNGLMPMLCSADEKFKYLRLSLSEKNFLHLNQLAILKNKQGSDLYDIYNQLTQELEEKYPFKNGEKNQPFFQYFPDSPYQSQCGQDYIVEQIFKQKKNGFFIEIGALDGISLSNTYLLEKQYDWQGLCIEPQKKQFQRLQNNRNCDCDSACLDGKKGLVNFVTYTDDPLNAAFSGMVADDLDNGSDSPNYARFEYEITTLETSLFADVLSQYAVPATIDYLSLDVEGAEYRILEKFPFHQYRFLFMNIERPPIKLIQLLERHDYLYLGKFHFDGYFVHNDLLDLYKNATE